MRSRAGLLERERELGELAALAERARRGRGVAAVVQGAPGIGKTALLDAFRPIAADAGLAVHGARGSEFERGLPFGVARQLLERSADAALFTGAAGPAAWSLGLPEPEGEPPASLFGALNALFWLCSNLAARTPLALLVDDAQWGDDPSVRWLGYLARRLDDLPVLLVAAGRALDDELAAQARAHLRLAPLSEVAVADLAAVAVPDASPAFCAACHRSAGGNPFLTLALLDELARRAVAPDDAGAVEDHGPGAVAASVKVRLRDLPPEAAAIVEVVSVVGTRAEVAEVAALAGVAPAVVGRLADALAAAGVLAPALPLDFAHPIVRRAVYDDLPAGRRAELHRRAALAPGQPVERAAAHLVHVPASGDERAVEVLVAAAAAARAAGAPAAAVAYLRRALGEPPAHPAAVLLELGRAERDAGDRGVVASLERAAAADDPLVRTAAGAELAAVRLTMGDAAGALDGFQAAIADALELDPDLALGIEANLIGLGQMDQLPAAAIAARIERLRTGPPEGATLSERLALGVLAFEAMRTIEPVDRVIALATRALAGPGPAIPDTPPLFLAWLALVYADRLDLAEPILDEEFARATRRGSLPGFAVCSMFGAELYLRAGDLDRAEAHARSAVEHLPNAAPAMAPIAAAELSDVLVERGQLPEAEALQAPGSLFTGPLLSRARLRLAQGRAGEAAADALAVGERALTTGGRNPSALSWRSVAAIALAASGEHDRARSLAGEELELARAFGAPRALGIALRAHALAGEPAQRRTALEEACRALTATPLEHARALTDLGVHIAAEGDPVAAREPLRRALDIAHRCGGAALAARARASLVGAGGRPRRAALTGPEALTASELRVARRAADGLSNPEIAQELWVTRRTVTVHLTAAYRKLGIHSRAELPAALSRHNT